MRAGLWAESKDHGEDQEQEGAVARQAGACRQGRRAVQARGEAGEAGKAEGGSKAGDGKNQGGEAGGAEAEAESIGGNEA